MNFRIFSIVVVVIAVASAAVWFLLPKGEESQSVRQQKNAKPVLVHEVRLENIETTNKIPGRVLAYRIAEIRPQVSGIIVERLFKEGSYVEAGQQLYQIDQERYAADFQMAEANVQTARAELIRTRALQKRYERLVAARAVSEQEYDNARAAAAQAEAALARGEAERRTAQINLEYTRVYAPISGYIGPSAVTEGALVAERQQQVLAVIRQLDPVYVDLSQPGSESQQLKKELIERRDMHADKQRYEVTLFLNERGDVYEHTGYIDATEQAVDEETGSIRLRSVFPNPDITLLPGMFVQATVARIGERRAILVPHKAVTIQPSGQKAVWVVAEDETVEKRLIQTGQSLRVNQWVVREGLEEGERIVTEGGMHLQPGDRVAVDTPAADPKEKASEQSR